MRLIGIALLALSIASAKDALTWRECSVKYGERIVVPQRPTINTGRQTPVSIWAGSLANRSKKVWLYVVDAGAQFYAVESKSALDIDIDQPTKYARKGGNFYIQDRNGKERTAKIVQQMSAAEAEEMARRE